eukprot:tig00021135_g18934.t1
MEAAAGGEPRQAVGARGALTLYQADQEIRGTLVRRAKIGSKVLILEVLLPAEDGEADGLRWKVVIEDGREDHLLQQPAQGSKLQPGDEVQMRGDIVVYRGQRGAELNFVPSAINLIARSSLVAGDAMKVAFAGPRRYPPLPPELQEEPEAEPAAAVLTEGAGAGAGASDHARQTAVPLCRAFRRGLACSKEGCGYRHVFAGEEERESVMRFRGRAAREREAAREPEDPHEGDSKSSKSHRAAIFAAWLVETFGAELLSSGSGVVEVAGGQGLLSHILSEVHGVRCTVVDPRREDGGTLVTLARALKKLGGGGGRGPGPAPPALPSEAAPGGGCGAGARRRFRRIEREFSEALVEAGAEGEAAALLRSCSAVVGLHPDQATDPIVKVALRLGVPFAVVPCCVFPSLFTERRRPGGEPVITYPHLVEYLKALAGPSAQETFLPFQGRNRVIWRPPGAPPVAAG